MSALPAGCVFTSANCPNTLRRLLKTSGVTASPLANAGASATLAVPSRPTESTIVAPAWATFPAWAGFCA